MGTYYIDLPTIIIKIGITIILFKQSLILMFSSDVTKRQSDLTDLCIHIRRII